MPSSSAGPPRAWNADPGREPCCRRLRSPVRTCGQVPCRQGGRWRSHPAPHAGDSSCLRAGASQGEQPRAEPCAATAPTSSIRGAGGSRLRIRRAGRLVAAVASRALQPATDRHCGSAGREPAEAVLRAAQGLWLHCLTSGRVGEGAHWMRVIIDRHPCPSESPGALFSWCRAAWVAGFLLLMHGDHDNAEHVIGMAHRSLTDLSASPAPHMRRRRRTSGPSLQPPSFSCGAGGPHEAGPPAGFHVCAVLTCRRAVVDAAADAATVSCSTRSRRGDARRTHASPVPAGTSPRHFRDPR